MPLLLAPRKLWGCLRVLLALALLGLGARTVRAQAGDAKKGEPPKGAETKAAAPAQAPGDAAPVLPSTPEEQDEAGVVDLSKAKRAARVEMFKDPHAEELLPYNKFTQLQAVRSAPSEREIKDMATGAVPSNRDQIQKFVNAQAAILTNQNNLKAVVDPEDLKFNSAVMKQFDLAAKALMEPLTLPAAVVSPAFRKDYVGALLATMPKLLNHHLYVRTEAMILLAMTGEPEAVPIFIAQLKDGNQVAMVKLWAARGLSIAAQNGKRDVDSGRANAAAKALSDFLQGEPETAWPVQMRALEALGSLRVPTDSQGQGMAEMAATALRFLADPNANPDVRAAAGWALGMMKTEQVPQLNNSLVAYYIGQAVADAGEKLKAASAENNPERATHLAGLIMFRLLSALRGEDGVRGSGLQNSPTLGPSGKSVGDIRTRVQAVAVAAFNLTSPATPKNQLDARRRDLDTRVAALKQYLSQNKPSSNRLTPGGPEFTGAEMQVAGGTAK